MAPRLNRIALDVATCRGLIIAIDVVVRLAFCVEELAKESQSSIHSRSVQVALFCRNDCFVWLLSLRLHRQAGAP